VIPSSQRVLVEDRFDVRFVANCGRKSNLVGGLKSANKRPQSITSALTRRDGGIVTPSALAVFMLMTKSKRVGP
jgi:hypothetical protein